MTVLWFLKYELSPGLHRCSAVLNGRLLYSSGHYFFH
jgi:hypothetical protein